jgi:four helix bundle protein
MSGRYQDSKVWQKALELTLAIYRQTKHFPHEEMDGLTKQMRRAAVSVTSNIAEGRESHRIGTLQFFSAMPAGSLHELETQFLIARDLGYLREEGIPTIQASIAETGKMLNGLINSMRPKLAERKSA